jgi:hypothetical protein
MALIKEEVKSVDHLPVSRPWIILVIKKFFEIFTAAELSPMAQVRGFDEIPSKCCAVSFSWKH